MKLLVEIRSYKLKANEIDQFHAIVADVVVPMLRSVGMDVVAFGPSAHEPDAYFLVRAFQNLAHLRSEQDVFYGSSAWIQGPRQSIIGKIESFLNALLWLSPDSVRDLRDSNPPGSPTN